MEPYALVKNQVASPEQLESLWEELESKIGHTVASLSAPKATAFFRVIGDSNFLARWARQNSHELQQLLLESWEQTIDGIALEKSWQSRNEKSNLSDLDTWSSQMLLFKYIHLFRITLKDLGGMVPFAQTAYELSALACFIIQKCLNYVARERHEQWGMPLDRMQKPVPFTVIALGKLGGMELNYSSDVDIMYLYGSDQGIIRHHNTDSERTPHQYFCKLGEQLGKILSKKTATGFLYRVDLDLRPEGKSGTLANSLSAMETYYESFGAYWEKQALIKSNCAAGDIGLFSEFHKMIQPFIFPKTSDFSLVEKVRDMKGKVEASLLNSSQQEYHVKLGRGGIREIEFFVQTLQILYGGRNPGLKSVNTLDALFSLKKEFLLAAHDEMDLRNAYIFLRTMEHRLQLVEEQQTHRLPKDEVALAGLAKRMGYFQANHNEATEKMLADLNKHRKNVMVRFDNLLERTAYQGAK